MYGLVRPHQEVGWLEKKATIQDTSTMCPKTYDLGTRNKGSSCSHLALGFPYDEEMRWPLQWSHRGRLYYTDPSVRSSARLLASNKERVYGLVSPNQEVD